jgi:hypothetical protein
MRLPLTSRHLRTALVMVITVPVLFGATPASSYRVWPLESIHEAMTLLAQQCLVSFSGGNRIDCRDQFVRLPELSARRSLMSYDDLQISVRWADDPARQTISRDLFRFLHNMTGNCERRAGPDSSGRIPRLDEVGILCSSHVGRLQFLHAQAVYGEDDPRTLTRILDWADLTYRVAIGEVQPTQRICDYFRMPGNLSSLSDSFELDARHCDPANMRAWTFATLFGSRCANPSAVDTCPQIPTAAGTNGLTVRTARGALLHLVQDSYSQSHVARGPTSPRPHTYVARVDCSLPSQFYSYYRQRGHKPADKVPEFAPNCRDRTGQADDPIAASAMVLFHIQRRTSPEVFNCYLQERVFGRRPRLGGEAEPAPCKAVETPEAA